jgi:DNA-binding MarR family transcriptional regulator
MGSVKLANEPTPEGLRKTKLCDDALLTEARISRLVGRMKGRGRVVRSGDPVVARAHPIRLRTAGAEVQRRLGREHGRQVADATSRTLDAKQLRTLRDLTRAMSSERNPR